MSWQKSVSTAAKRGANSGRRTRAETAYLAPGEVNLGAIDEFERVNERQRFLNEQRNDLIEAKATLHQVIREMETEMAKRFNRTFHAIREEFGAVFARLFGGGRADLVLTDPERSLETGVDIVAQPPGKKLQNMQLSIRWGAGVDGDGAPIRDPPYQTGSVLRAG